ncbi:MAG: SDR family oxidoreductase [Dehalococcoidia bacterium]|jgi:3-oxoacyl-[acyl-carrier protein] reductase
MEIHFENKVVLITGATHGIGKQLAHDFGKLGAELILTGTRPDEIKELNENLIRNNRKNIKYYCADFLSEDSLFNLTHELRKFSKIDVCINNSGINRIDYIYDTSLTDWSDIINVNLKAPFVICREVSQIMKKNGYGKIINIASIFGVISREKRSIYSSTKSGLIGLTRAAAIDLAPYNILVNCVSPGFVLTDLTKKTLSETEIKDLVKRIPMGRLATPEDISKVILFLSSELNTYISGQNIIVDGGYVNT